MYIGHIAWIFRIIILELFFKNIINVLTASLNKSKMNGTNALILFTAINSICNRLY